MFAFPFQHPNAPNVGLLFASKEKNRSKPGKYLAQEARTDHGLKLKRLCSTFGSLPCNYPTAALGSAAKNNVTRIYVKPAKTALPLEGILCQHGFLWG